MDMRMRVDYPIVGVPVGVDQIGSQQQLMIGQDLRRRAGRFHSSILQHENAVSDIVDDLQLMGRRDNCSG